MLSLGNNNIKALDNLLYMRRFDNLRTINLKGNPVCLDAEYKNYLLAKMKNLRYLDYRLIDESAIQAAKDLYQDELIELNEKESQDERRKEKARSEAEKQAQHRDANMQGVENVFNEMFSDAESKKLEVLPIWKELIASEREEFDKLYSSFETEMGKTAKLKQREIASHSEAWAKSRSGTQEASIKLIQKYEKEKKQLLREMPNNEAVVYPKLTAHLEKADELWTLLMEQEMIQVEESTQLNAEFERRYGEVRASTLEIITNFFAKMHEMEKEFHEKLLVVVSRLLEASQLAKPDSALGGAAAAADDDRVRGDVGEDELTAEARQMLGDKDALMNSLSASHESRISKIDAKEEELQQGEKSREEALQLKNETDERERNRNRINEIAEYIPAVQKEIKEVLESDEGDYT